MNQPPRLDNSGNPLGSSPARGPAPSNQFGSSPNAPYQMPPPRRTNRWLIAIGSVLIGLLVVCGGFVIWLAYSFQAPSSTTADYREHRAPIGQILPDKFKQTIRSGEQLDDPVLPEMEEFLLSVADSWGGETEEFIDVPRFVQEMQNSGRAVGLNFLSRLVWIESLKFALSVPELSEDTEIIALEWLQPDRELRLTVAAYWPEYDQPEIWLLYMKRSGDQWKLYDWRDVLEAASEAQFYAMQSAAPIRQQDSYVDLTNETNDIYYDDAIAWDSKATKTLSALNQHTYPDDILPLAQSNAAAYLVLYDAADQLRQVVGQMDPQKCAATNLYRSRLALMDEDKDAAFREAGAVIDKVGWHPAAAILAGRAAETDEQKSQAARWLARSVRLAPAHTESIQLYFDVASREQVGELLASVSETRGAFERVLAIVDATLYTDESEQAVSLIRDALSESAAFAPVVEYLELQQLMRESEFDAALPVAAKLLENPEFSERQAELNGDLVQIAREVDLKLVLAAAPDQTQFMRLYRDTALLSRWGSAPIKDWTKVLDALQDRNLDGSFAEEVETRTAIARCYMQLEDYQAALNSSMKTLLDQGSELLSEDPPSCTYQFFDTAARSAFEIGAIDKLADAIDDPESAFVILANKLDDAGRYDDLTQLIAWYENQAAPEVWMHYYRAATHFAEGNWPATREAMELAIEEAAFDDRIAEGELPFLVSEFGPDASDLMAYQIEFAFRLGKLPALVTDAANEKSLDDTWTYQLAFLLDEYEATDTGKEVGRILLQSRAESLQQLGHELIADALEAEGKYVDAIRELIAAAKLVAPDEDYYGENKYFSEALRAIAAYDQFDLLADIRTLEPQTMDEESLLATVQSVQARNASEFMTSLEDYESEYESDQWFWHPGLIVALQEAGMWDAVNTEENPVDLDSVSYEYINCGLVYTNKPISEIRAEIESCFTLEGAAIQDFEKRFPDSVAAWSKDTPEGQLLVIGFDGLPSAIAEDSDFAGKLAEEKFVGALYVGLQRKLGNCPPMTQMRTLVGTACQELPAAIGYSDYHSDCWFEGDGWPARLVDAANHGIDAANPRARYLSWTDYVDDEFVVDVDGQSYLRITGTFFIEQIPVAAPSSPSSSPTETPTVFSLRADSLSMPCLTQGTFVNTSDAGYDEW